MDVSIVIHQGRSALLVVEILRLQFSVFVTRTLLINVTYMGLLMNVSTVNQHTSFKQISVKKIILVVLWADLMEHALSADFQEY